MAMSMDWFKGNVQEKKKDFHRFSLTPIFGSPVARLADLVVEQWALAVEDMVLLPLSDLMSNSAAAFGLKIWRHFVGILNSCMSHQFPNHRSKCVQSTGKKGKAHHDHQHIQHDTVSHPLWCEP